MHRRNIVSFTLSIVLVVICAQLMAQQDVGPILRPRKSVAPATVLVTCDLACNWKLDDKTRGVIEAGESAKAPLSLGQHIVIAVTQDGLDKVETEIEIKTAGQTIVHLVLQPVRDARVKAEQDAQIKSQEQAAKEQAAREQQEKEQQARERIAHEQMERTAEAFYKDLRYADARPLLDQTCADGSATACDYLGLMYANGRDVSKDEDRAKVLYSKACAAGSADGCYNLGCILGAGLQAWGGPAEDHPRAAALFSKACDSGHAEACYRAGMMYSSADGVAQNTIIGASLYKKACDGGSADGCFWLGNAYLDGKGVEKDESRGRAILGKACSLGLQVGCEMAH
jgi:TPR repeat protein